MAHLASPRHGAGHTEWVHARELSTLVVEMKYYRMDVLREGSGESPRGEGWATIYGCKDDYSNTLTANGSRSQHS